MQTTNQLWILATFYLNRDYIAANICINRFDKMPVCKGSCYLEKKINENKQQQDKSPDIKTNITTLFCETNSVALPSITHTVIPQKYSSYKNSFHQSQYLQSVFRPPILIG